MKKSFEFVDMEESCIVCGRKSLKGFKINYHDPDSNCENPDSNHSPALFKISSSSLQLCICPNCSKQMSHELQENYPS